jgi:hypothetical protein
VCIEAKNPEGGLIAGVHFRLAVISPAAASTRIAAVAATRLIARRSNLTSSYSAAVGQYVVVTDTPASWSAIVVTRGSIDQVVPFAPTTVEIVPGPAVNTAGIQERSLLAFGGQPSAGAIHAAIVS